MSLTGLTILAILNDLIATLTRLRIGIQLGIQLLERLEPPRERPMIRRVLLLAVLRRLLLRGLPRRIRGRQLFASAQLLTRHHEVEIRGRAHLVLIAAAAAKLLLILRRDLLELGVLDVGRARLRSAARLARRRVRVEEGVGEVRVGRVFGFVRRLLALA